MRTSVLVLFLILLAMGILGLHYALIATGEIEEVFSLLKLYSFLFISTALSVALLVFLIRNAQDKAAYAFMAIIFIKGGLAIFLFPQLLADNPKLTRPELLQFLLPYFGFLILETWCLVHLLNAAQQPVEASED